MDDHTVSRVDRDRAADAARRYQAGEDLDYVDLYEAGLSIAEVGKLMGVSDTYMHRLLQAAGVQMRPKRHPRTVLTDAQAADAVSRRRRDESLQRIAEALRVPRGAVRDAVLAAGLTVGPSSTAQDPQESARLSAEAKRRYEQCGSIHGVARQMGRSQPVVRQLLVDAGVKFPQRRRREWDSPQERADAARQAVKLYGDGAGLGEVADQLDRSVTWVHRVLQAEGLELRPSGSHDNRIQRPRPDPDEYQRRCEVAKRLYEALGATDKVARTMRHSFTTVRRMLADAGVQVPPRPAHQDWASPQERAEVGRRAARLYRDGASIGDVAAQLGRKPATVRKLLDEQGVQIRRPGGTRRARDTSTRAPQGPTR